MICRQRVQLHGGPTCFARLPGCSTGQSKGCLPVIADVVHLEGSVLDVSVTADRLPDLHAFCATRQDKGAKDHYRAEQPFEGL